MGCELIIVVFGRVKQIDVRLIILQSRLAIL